MQIVLFFNILIVLLAVLIWLVTISFLKIKKKKSNIYLIFLTIFYIYIFKVLDYTLFQFQTLLLLKYFMPNLMLNGLAAGKNLNLIPLIALSFEDIKTSLLNILLFIPFGFGLPFITDLRMKKIIVLGMFFSITIEFIQLMTGIMANTTFRIADINDVLFNTVGVLIGCILFSLFLSTFRNLTLNTKNSFIKYITQRPQIDK